MTDGERKIIEEFDDDVATMAEEIENLRTKNDELEGEKIAVEDKLGESEEENEKLQTRIEELEDELGEDQN